MKDVTYNNTPREEAVLRVLCFFLHSPGSSTQDKKRRLVRFPCKAKKDPPPPPRARESRTANSFQILEGTARQRQRPDSRKVSVRVLVLG